MSNSVEAQEAVKPAYSRPELAELNVGATENGVVFGPQPENESYIS